MDYSPNDEPSRKRRCIRTLCNGVHDSCMNDRYKCCICMDKRPIDELYNSYIDGVGYCKSINRSKYYCPSCKCKVNSFF